jgi:thiol-disulfide isomerase/thioredoxin
VKRNAIVLAVVVIAVAVMLYFGRRVARPGYGGAKTQVVGKANGSPAPEFELTSLDGKQVKLSDFRGKAVLLNFWATWCSPCKIEMPWFIELQKQYGPQGLQVLGVAMDDAGKDDIAKFAREMGVDYPVLLGKEAVGEAYGGVQFLPTTFYIDRNGRVVERVFGLVSRKAIEENITKALGSGTAQASAGSRKP